MTRKIHMHCTYCMTKGYFGRKLWKIYAQLINPSYDSSDYSHDKLGYMHMPINWIHISFHIIFTDVCLDEYKYFPSVLWKFQYLAFHLHVNIAPLSNVTPVRIMSHKTIYLWIFLFFSPWCEYFNTTN